MTIAWIVIAASAALTGYAYAGYPALLGLIGRFRRPKPVWWPREWPEVTITVPVYNGADVIGETLDAILAVEYPSDRRHVLVISDASSDGTDDIVRRYAHRGVRLLRLPQRGGKTAAENAARTELRGSIVVNTDASVRLDPNGLKPLIAAFQDPTVGIASGCDISVAHEGDLTNAGEAGYVGYEMWVRDLETRLGGIVGASGCFYASRTELHKEVVPSALSRDFAAPLIARENGYRSVSVNDALCYVPRVKSLTREYQRKVRTMTRGLETLYYKRHLLNPFRYPRFAWMLFSHKLARWLVPWAAFAVLVAVSAMAVTWVPARVVLGTAVIGILLGVVGWYWPAGRRAPKVVSFPAYVLFGLLAGLHSWWNALRGDLNPTWEPTKRELAARP